MSFSNNEEEIEKFFNFVQIDDEAFVTQTFKGGPITSGKVLVDNSEDLIEEANKHTAEGLICLSVNARNSTNKGIESVTNLNNIVVDIDVEDCVREEGVSPQKWKDKAKHVVREVTKDLEELGISRNLLVDSGNGFHVYAGVDIDIPEEWDKEDWKDSEIYSKLSELENILRENNIEKEVLVDEDGEMVEELKTVIKVDTLTSDLARRMKMPGTHNVKPEIPEKNYRMAEILEIEEPDREENSQALMDIEVQQEEEIDTTSLDYDSSGSSLSDREKIEKARKFDDTLDDLLGMYEYGDEGRSGVDIRLAEKAVYYGIDVETMIKAGVTDKYQDNRDGQKYIQRQRRDAEGMVTDNFDWSGQEKIDDVLDLEDLKLEEDNSEDDVELKIDFPKNHFISMFSDYMRPTDVHQTPVEYEIAGGLFLLAVSTDRYYQDSKYKDQPNMIIQYLGKSSVGKSFPKAFAKNVLQHTFIEKGQQLSERQLTKDITPESMIKNAMETSSMDDEEYEKDGDKEKRYILSEESSDFWSSMTKDSGDVSSTLTKIIDHDGEPFDPVGKSTVTGKGEKGIKRPFLNMLGGTQPRTFFNSINPNAVVQGLIGRLFIVNHVSDHHINRDGRLDSQPRYRSSKLINQRKELNRRLSAIYSIGYFNGQFGRYPLRMDLEQEALDMWAEWAMEVEELAEDMSDVMKSIMGKVKGKLLKLSVLIQLGSEEFYDHSTDYIQALCERDDTNCKNDKWKDILDHGSMNKIKDEVDSNDIGTPEISKEAMQLSIHYMANLFIPSMIEAVADAMKEDSEEKRVMDYAMRKSKEIEGRKGSYIRKRDFRTAKHDLKLNRDIDKIKDNLRKMGFLAEVTEETNSDLYNELTSGRGRNGEYYVLFRDRSSVDIPTRGVPDSIPNKDFLDF